MLLRSAKEAGVPVISSMGAGLNAALTKLLFDMLCKCVCTNCSKCHKFYGPFPLPLLPSFPSPQVDV